jgi:uncharacterized protein YrzB (UPF0473 family)
MPENAKESIEAITLVKDAYGDHVELIDAEGASVTYQLLAEFRVGTVAYAILQDEVSLGNDEVDVFHILQQEGGTLELMSVDDDEEWEDIAELYDELTISFDE